MTENRDKALSLTLARKGHGIYGEYCYLEQGATLFERFINSSQDYYPFHGDKDLIAEHADDIADTVLGTQHAVIVGQGPWTSVLAKELPILDRMPDLRRIDLIDIVETYNRIAVSNLRDHYNDQNRSIHVEAHRVNYRSSQALRCVPRSEGQTTVICTGGTFANVANAAFEGTSIFALSETLAALRNLAGPHGNVLVTYDSSRNKQALHSAYRSDVLDAFYLQGLRAGLESSASITGIDPEKLEDHFEISRKWYPQIGHYAHKLRVREDADPVSFTIDNQWVRASKIPLDPCEEFTLMSCIKPDSHLIRELGNSRGMTTRFKISGQHENTIHVFKNDFDELPAPRSM